MKIDTYPTTPFMVTTRCLTTNNDMNPRWHTTFGMLLSCMAKWLGLGWSSSLRLVFTWQKAFLKNLMRHGGLRMCFVDGIGWGSLATKNVLIDSSCPACDFWWLGVCPWWGFGFLFPCSPYVLHLSGPACPWNGCIFSFGFKHWHWLSAFSLIF